MPHPKPKSTQPKVKATKRAPAEQRAEIDRVAKEHGADLSEEQFNKALGKVARHKPLEAADGSSKQD